ncbi:MAG TPA: substrate-binding domain-containing protein [Hydrogenophaga sp.]|nr:substrate-binding domain-containing protein [Hydrogenophaga sp.]
MPDTAVPALRGISSMATRLVLADLIAAYTLQASAPAISIESVGGVDAARRVVADEPFDLVVLASDAIDKLAAAGKVLPGSRVDLVRSGVALAVQAGAPIPDISTEAAVRQAVLAARSLSYSTGPSGVALAKLFERWGLSDVLRERIVQAPPGVPVGTLVARGEVELGFQQLSELLHVDGITLLGPLPDAIQITTTFSGAVCVTARQPDAARDFIAFMASPDALEAKKRQGMDPA